MRSNADVRVVAWLGLIGVAIFVAAMVALHLLQPELSPTTEAVSYYVHGKHGWLTTAGIIALGVGSQSIAVALVVNGVARSPAGRLGIAALAIWSWGAILGGVFAADPPGNWDQPPSISGSIHGIAAMIALAAFPVAAVALTRAASLKSAVARPPAGLALFATASVASYVVFLFSLVPVFVRPGPPILLGLTERVLLAAYCAWLCAAAIGLLRSRDRV